MSRMEARLLTISIFIAATGVLMVAKQARIEALIQGLNARVDEMNDRIAGLYRVLAEREEPEREAGGFVGFGNTGDVNLINCLVNMTNNPRLRR